MTPAGLPDRAPYRLWTGRVRDSWLDYNGHMTESRYLQVFGESSDAFYAAIGVAFERAREGAFYTLETHIRHLAECPPDAALATETQLLGHDGKRLHLFHRLIADAGTVAAEAEHLSIHVRDGTSAAIPEPMLARIRAAHAAGVALPLPRRVGLVLTRPLEISRLS